MIKLEQDKRAAEIISEWTKEFEQINSDYLGLFTYLSSAFEIGGEVSQRGLDVLNDYVLKNMQRLSGIDECKDIKNEIVYLLFIIFGRGYITKRYKLFNFGKLFTTRTIRNLSFEHKIEIQTALMRHLSGDFGDSCDQDKKRNFQSILNNENVLSEYTIQGEIVYIQTELSRTDQAVTIIMNSRDY